MRGPHLRASHFFIDLIPGEYHGLTITMGYGNYSNIIFCGNNFNYLVNDKTIIFIKILRMIQKFFVALENRCIFMIKFLA